MKSNHTNEQSSERLSIRLTPEMKQRIEQAAALDHRSITRFIIASAVAYADEVLKRNHQVILNEKDWNTFYDALINPPKPNKALRKAFADYKKLNIRSDV